MNLFIDAVSQTGVLLLFNHERQILDSFEIHVVGQEVQKLASYIDTFLKKNTLSLEDITHIVVVHGPGSFTGIRTIVLIVNTYAFVFPTLCLTALSYFDLFDTYPIVLPSSKRDVFLQKSFGEDIEIVSNQVLGDFFAQLSPQKIYGSLPLNDFGDICVENKPNYRMICQTVVFQNNKRIEPLYIKKPNIT